MARWHIGQFSLGTSLFEVASVRPEVEVVVEVVLAWRGTAMHWLAMEGLAMAAMALSWLETMAVLLAVGPPLGTF